MIIGVPKEVKDHESRVAITPAGVKSLTEAGHKVLLETRAGDSSALTDDEYQDAGAEIVGSPHSVWGLADMVVKVKGTCRAGDQHFREGLVLFTNPHSAPPPDLTDAWSAPRSPASRTRRYAILRWNSSLRLTPMSEVAGRTSVQGRRILPPARATRWPRRPPRRRSWGSPSWNVCIIGGGIVGTNAGEPRRRHGREGDHRRPHPHPPARARRHLSR